MDHNDTFAQTMRLIKVTSTTTPTPVATLVKAALDAKVPIPVLPRGSVIQMVLTPESDVLVSDFDTLDQKTLLAGVRYTFPALNVHQQLCLDDAADVWVELYFGEP